MIKKAIFPLLAATLMTACSNDPNPLVTGYGDVSIMLSVDGSVTSVAGAPTIDVATPSIEQLKLSAVNNLTHAEKQWESLAKFEAGSQKLPVGDYTFSAYYGDKDAEGFITPAFYSETSGSVMEDRETVAEIHCRVAQTLVSATMTDAARALARDITLRAKTEEGEYVSFASTETRTACLRPGLMRCELVLTDAGGRTVALQPFDNIRADAACHHQMRFDADGGALTCVSDNTTASSPYRLTVDDALFSTPSPTFTAKGFDSDNSYNMLEYSVPAEGLGVDISIPGGLANLYLTVVSPSMTDNYWPAETDIVPATDLAAHGIVATGLEKGSTSVALNLQQVVARMNASAGSTTTHHIILQARDQAGRVAVTPMALTVECRPVTLQLKQPAALQPSASKATIEIETNGELPVDRLSFETTDNLTTGIWQPTEATVRRVAVGRYEATVDIEQGMGSAYVRAVYGDGIKTSEPAAIKRNVPDYAVDCRQENIWPSQVDLIFSGDNLKEVVPYINVMVQQEGGNWHPAVVERNVDERRVTIKTLTPSTSYNVIVASAADKTKEFHVTTESALELPNADFEDIEETINIKNINCGGKYSNLASWMPIYNKASILVKEPKKWASVNKKTCAAFAETRNTWFQVPTTEIIPSTGSSQWAVRLRNAAWCWHGVEPQRDARTDRQYYSSYVPTFENRSAGKLFLGSYSVENNGKETYNEGIGFTSRPTAVSGIYTFVQDRHDTAETGLVVVRLVNDEGGEAMEIGRGVGYLRPSTSFTRFNVPITYTVRNKRATRLMLMVSSSSHASYSISEETMRIKTTDNLKDAVSIGAELTVDELSLLYE